MCGYEVSGGIQEVCFKVAGSCVQTVPVPACQYHCSDTRFLSLGFARVSGFSMVVIQISTDYLYSLVHIYLRSVSTVHLGVGLLILCGYCAHGRGQTDCEDGTKSPPHYLWLSSRRALTFQ